MATYCSVFLVHVLAASLSLIALIFTYAVLDGEIGVYHQNILKIFQV